MSSIDSGPLILRVWDHGLIGQLLASNKLFPRELSPEETKAAQGLIVPATGPARSLSVGSFSGTAKIMTDVFHRIEDRFHSFFDVIGIAPSIPLTNSVKEKQFLYEWSASSGPNADKYPPHLNLIPAGPDGLSPTQIFDTMRLLDTGFILSAIIPDNFKDFLYSHPDQGGSMDAIDIRNKELRAQKKNILSEPNVGDREKTKWYTDEGFAQQQFTGTNPATIEIAADRWIEQFRQAAVIQKRTDMTDLISSAGKDKSLYVQDCSYFRDAAGISESSEFKATVTDGQGRYACASVTLFHLTPQGKLHPLAIVIDYKVSMDKSVVIFNQRLGPEVAWDQVHDWPWRYAKTCAQSADWIRHEVTVHLTNCHLVEEATIVASHRKLPTNHLVYRILQPHWLKTLALNAAARATLVPQVVVPLIGMTDDQTYTFLADAYKRFDWQANYVPTDLKRRGFPLEALLDMNEKRFHNYAYGKDILLMWNVLRKFVKSYLNNGGAGFTTDDKVANDPSIKAWCEEMQNDKGGQMPTWPSIKTVDQLVDCVTMCIHIASPQHTAVNYLQEYYQSFVVNRPPAMCAPLPQDLNELNSYAEKQLMDSLPINRPREWLLASHLVHLLSYKVPNDQNLINYGISLYHLSEQSGEKAMQDAAKQFVNDLVELGDTTNSVGETVPGVFSRVSMAMDDQEVPYRVLDPVATAVSILI